MSSSRTPTFLSEMPNLATDTEATITSPINVMIVDDHNLILFALSELLTKLDHINLVGEAQSVAEGKEILNDTDIDVDIIVLDLNLFDSHGLDLVRYCKRQNKPVKVIVLTSCDDDDSIRDALALGVHAYCSKNILSHLEGIIHHVYNDGLWFDPVIGNKIVTYFNQASPISSVIAANEVSSESIPDLSAVEHEILTAYAKGCSIREVSEMLDFSPNTIKVYSSKIYKKLGVANRGQALNMVFGSAAIQRARNL